MILLLAAAMWVTYPNPKNPNEYLTYQEGESIKMPRPILSGMDQIVEEERIADPTLQRGPEQSGSFDYDQLERRYPVRSVLPQNQRQTMTTEDAMAMEDYRTERMARDISIKGALLNQKIAQRDLQYKDNVITQAEAVQKLIGGLKPGSPTFDSQVAELNLLHPLAQQNNGVQSQIDRISQTHTQMARDQTIRDEGYNRADALDNARQQDAMDMAVANLGSRYQDIYDEAISKGQTPNKAYGIVMDSRATDLSDRKLQPELLDSRDYLAYSKNMERLLRDKDGDPRKVEDLTPAEQREYNFIQSQMRTFIDRQNPQGQPGTGGTAPPKNFFP